MKTIKELFIKYKEIIMYLIMGGATTVVNWGVYAGSVSLLSGWEASLGTFKMNVLVANVLAWVIAVIFAYVTNKIFVFESYSWKLSFVLKELSLFVTARLVTGLLEIIGVPFLVGLGFDQTIFGIEGMVCKLCVSVIVVVLNYVFSKLIIFKNDDK